jgi:hypothetical protein
MGMAGPIVLGLVLGTLALLGSVMMLNPLLVVSAAALIGRRRYNHRPAVSVHHVGSGPQDPQHLGTAITCLPRARPFLAAMPDTSN